MFWGFNHPQEIATGPQNDPKMGYLLSQDLNDVT
jgi:hypothetical protein